MFHRLCLVLVRSDRETPGRKYGQNPDSRQTPDRIFRKIRTKTRQGQDTDCYGRRRLLRTGRGSYRFWFFRLVSEQMILNCSGSYEYESYCMLQGRREEPFKAGPRSRTGPNSRVHDIYLDCRMDLWRYFCLWVINRENNFTKWLVLRIILNSRILELV